MAKVEIIPAVQKAYICETGHGEKYRIHAWKVTRNADNEDYLLILSPIINDPNASQLKEADDIFDEYTIFDDDFKEVE